MCGDTEDFGLPLPVPCMDLFEFHRETVAILLQSFCKSFSKSQNVIASIQQKTGEDILSVESHANSILPAFSNYQNLHLNKNCLSNVYNVELYTCRRE